MKACPWSRFLLSLQALPKCQRLALRNAQKCSPEEAGKAPVRPAAKLAAPSRGLLLLVDVL